MRFTIIVLYGGLLYLFRKLIGSDNEILAPMKNQVTFFFAVTISAMLVRLVNEIALDWIFFKDEQLEVPTRKARKAFFWLGVLNMFSDLAFSGLIINYLMTTNSQREEEESETP